MIKELHTKSKLFNQKDVLELEEELTSPSDVSSIVGQAIQADKDILSKITIVEEEGYTYITFPYGVFPLALLTDSVAGLNKYLYIKNGTLVDNTGNKVFDIDEFVSDDNVLEITLVGDNLDLEIIALDYILFNGGNGLGDTYQLYYPQPQLENIVDKDGHKRFIEGDFTPETISGVTYTYHKWSLSGTHLMFVLAGTIADTTALPFSALAYITLPSWIFNKIYPTYGIVIERKSQLFGSSDTTTQSGTAILFKDTTQIRISLASITMTATRSFRIAFDLLIDNE